jgi:hypothetical protein
VTRFLKLSAEPDVWEYRQIDLNELPPKTDEVDVLNQLGEQGWELVAILHNHVAHLKRRTPETRKAVAVSRSSSPTPPKTPPRSPRAS